MGTVIAVASGKGGTGKTSFCANIAVSLCALGEKVLVIDADSGLRSLDLVLGMTDRLLFSYGDVIRGNASLKEAAVTHPVAKNLRVLTAPGEPGIGEVYDPKDIAALLKNVRAHFTIFSQIGQENCAIVVNRLRPGMIREGSAANIDRAMDASGLSLLGVVPEDQAVIASGNRGTIMALDHFGQATQAYLNIAKRLRGQRVQLLSQVPGREWKK